MQVSIGTGQGVRRSKRPLSECYTVANVLWKPLISQKKVEFENHWTRIIYFVGSFSLGGCTIFIFKLPLAMTGICGP